MSMQQTYRRCASILLLTLVLILPGCSYFYNLNLEGKLLSGAEQTPVTDAKVTLVLLQSDLVSTTTDQQGRWKLKGSLHDSNFRPGEGKQYWLRQDRVKVRIETRGETYLVPCPRVALPRDGGEIYAFVMTVLDAHPEPKNETSQIEEFPLEAVKPVHSDNH